MATRASRVNNFSAPIFFAVASETPVQTHKPGLYCPGIEVPENIGTGYVLTMQKSEIRGG